jgi:hypothetical protein
MCAAKTTNDEGGSSGSSSLGVEAKGTESEEAFGGFGEHSRQFKNNENRKKNQTEREAGHNVVINT